ncbi:hypothetical protein POV27_02280 [Aureisphaera galaxeae]|uniref:hypothetical protein n=1 Tax=Aureisphaera galaxeae TaxID=1538023 RepID=UPI0023508773|nr:hypothetical protein [Aureisphaera galaxeae]MDC8002869.1 hypothetical protein [Aureisphaera galaxeae]
MKRFPLLLALFISLGLFGQQVYEIDGNGYSLNVEVEGELTLLWNIIDGEYRYFSKKGDDIQELKNTRVNKEYQEEYKTVLAEQTSNHPTLTDNKVNLTLPSLRRFYIAYNRAVDPTFYMEEQKVVLKARLGGFAGMTNYPYIPNPDNTLLPQFGVDFELIDEAGLKRHSLLFQFRQIVASSDYDVNSSQFSFNYRFKFVYTDVVDIFVNTKIADYVYISPNIPDPDSNPDTVETFTKSGGEFQAPFSFGIGADIPIGKGYITLGYYDILALNLNDNGEFPMDFVVGYKFNL